MQTITPYCPQKPNYLGRTLIEIELKEIIPFINWTFFFNTWKLSGKYEGIEHIGDCVCCKKKWINNFPFPEQAKATEALSVFQEAQQILEHWVLTDTLKAKAVIYLGKSTSTPDDSIQVFSGEEIISFPMLRQQESDSEYLSIADFIRPDNDYIGLFALTTGLGLKEYISDCDDYTKIIAQSLADRLAEAAAEWLHQQVRKKYWGYAEKEELSVSELFKNKYQGIRPAIGYPCIPDQSLIFKADRLLHLSDIGISITENAAMLPGASICGFMISNPNAHYFIIKKIGEDQLTDYAERNQKPVDEERRWLQHIL